MAEKKKKAAKKDAAPKEPAKLDKQQLIEAVEKAPPLTVAVIEGKRIETLAREDVLELIKKLA